MNRDALLATIIGFCIGLLITGAFLVGPNLVKSFPKLELPDFALLWSKEKTMVTPTPVADEKSSGLTITSPLEGAIEQNDELLVSGSATAGATLIIAGPTDETVVTAGSDGTFAGKTMLSEGENTIVVTGYHKNTQESQSVIVFYTPEEL